MFRYRREMYALQFKYVYLALLIIAFLSFNEAIANGRGRRRYGPAQTSTKPAKEATEKSTTDQVPASSNTEANQYRRGGAYSTDGGDYNFNTADINLIRPESKPLHTKITAKYTSSISIPTDSLEDTETAEEYVAKAMGMYGSRLREPIRIPSESETSHVAAEQPQLQATYIHHPSHPQQHQQHLQQHSEQHSEQHSQQHTQQHLQHQHQQEQQQLQQLHSQEKPEGYDYYSYSQKEVQKPEAPQQQQQQQVEEEEQQPQHQSQPQYQYAAQTQTEEDAKAALEAHMRAQLQEQLHEAQYRVKEQQESQQVEQNQEENITHEPNQAYEKDPVTRSYNIYEEHTESYDAGQSGVDRNYRTKYIYKPISSAYHTMTSENEEKIRVSASTEIPKAEIMKQIEKSVIRYMKELEAEGKIIAAPQNQEPKTYFKVITVPGSDEKRIASSTLKPKYSSSGSNYPEGYKYGHSHLQGGQSQASGGPNVQKHHKNSGQKTAYVTENEGTFQTQGHEVADALAQNVEFIYKIKTKAPLHTATVKTVSKPYNLPLKTNYEQFDHSTALKNLEDFDLSHVVTTPDTDDPQSVASASTSKPSKLYFNSEIYHDINAMPYKQKQQRPEGEYRKVKQPEAHPDYKGYGGNGNSGYYAEPPNNEAERDTTGSAVSEDGYPVMNPYQYVLKKEPAPNKYEDSQNSYEQPRGQKYKAPVEYDSYSPKFNNNPEGYGYQQTYKTHLSNRHSPGKRGKRGGVAHPSQAKKSPHRSSSLKDYEANVALRPPPKV